jgi:hypothetical protein
MKPPNRLPLFEIAKKILAKHFGDLDPAIDDDLARSVARQWHTYDGHAGIITPTRNFWFQMVATENGVQIGENPAAGNWGRVLAEEWHVAEEEIPGLLHQLNLGQSATCRTVDGRTIRMRVEPAKRTVRCEEQPAHDETEL